MYLRLARISSRGGLALGWSETMRQTMVAISSGIGTFEMGGSVVCRAVSLLIFVLASYTDN